MSEKINLTGKQRKALERLWFIYGNGGPNHSAGNHKTIQGILERGEDDRGFYKRQGRVAGWKPVTPECLAEIDKVLHGYQPDFTRLAKVYELARKAQVSFNMFYDEGENCFSFHVVSAAPTENFVGRDRSFDIAVDDVIEHLSKICTASN